MSTIKFTSADGREKPLSEFGNEIKKGLELRVKETTIRRIESACCPVHGQSPKNVQLQIEGNKVQWTFEKCCDELERAAAAAMQSA